MRVKEDEEQNDTKQTNDKEAVHLHVAIIGASYAGLILANTLQLHSIPYTIFDCKSVPFPHVMGGNNFHVPSFDSIAKRLKLNVQKPRKLEWPTRKDVIVSLLERVRDNLLSDQYVVHVVEKRGCDYLLFTQRKSMSTPTTQNTIKHGPYQLVVGADGVLSNCRKRALPHTFLIGDARWVNDRWYDLGMRRINQGADIAMMDGLELGESMARAIHRMKNVNEIVPHIHAETHGKFCARGIFLQRIKRQGFVAGMLLGFVVWRFCFH